MKTVSYFKRSVIVALLLAVCFNATNAQSVDQSNDRMDWWKDAKFGMFIHWGLYSQTAGYWNGKPAKGKEHFMIHEKISLEDYSKIANDFNPTEYNAEEWVLLAKQAGMEYMVITTKHHEGFAMYDSKASDYNIVKATPYGKDPMKELADACHKHDMKLGFYYSLGRDWEDPDVPTNWPTKGGRSNLVDFPDEDSKVFNRYFERKVKPQMTELLTQYGQVDLVWFDTPELISKEESLELRDLILELQPNCVINNRIGNGLGDYKTPEQEIGRRDLNNPWESCITMSQNWGFVEYDTLYKSPELLTRFLVEIVSNGGNLLLNVGPTPQGEITQDAQVRLATIGQWMDLNAEGIKGAKPSEILSESLLESVPKTGEKVVSEEEKLMEDAVKDGTSKDLSPMVMFTSKGDDLYAFVCSYNEESVNIQSLGLDKGKMIKTVTPLGVSSNPEWKQTDKGLEIAMPNYPVAEIPVVAFKITY